MGNNFSRWPDKLPFRNEDGSWTLEWWRWFSRIDNMTNSANGVPVNPFLPGAGGTFAEGSGGGESLSVHVGSQARQNDSDQYPPIIPRPSVDGMQMPPTTVPVKPQTNLALLAALNPTRTVVPMVIRDTHSNRANYPASAYQPATLYVESDTTVVYQNSGSAWVYLSGQYSAALASIPALGANDAGYLFFENAVYFHQLQWSGSAWGRGPNDLEHSDTFQDFGAAPTDGGWHACDGTSVTYLKYDGTTGTRTVPNLAATAAYPKQGSSYSSSLAAPTLPTLTMNSYTPAGTNSAPTFTGSPQSFTDAAFTNAGVSPTAFIAPNPYTPAGTVSAPVFTGTPATLTGTIALPDDPIEHYSVIRYYRR